MDVVLRVGWMGVQEVGEGAETRPHLDVGRVVSSLQPSAVLNQAVQGVQHLALTAPHVLTEGAAVGGDVQHQGKLHVAIHLS